jgi:hypothetical protein
MFEVEVFWVVTLCSLVVGYQFSEVHAASLFSVMGYDAMWCCDRMPTFRRSTLPPSSGVSSRGLLGCDAV